MYPGVEIIFAYLGKTLNEFYGEGNEIFNGWWKLKKGKVEENLEQILKSESVDLIHSHNAPDYLTLTALKIKESLGIAAPLIHDVHDLISTRITPYGNRARDTLLTEEEAALRKSDGIIFVSSVMKEMAEERYDLTAPSVVFPNYIPKDLIPCQLQEKLSRRDGKIHLVYEGTVDSGTNSHYDLVNIFRQIAKQGIFVHLYVSKEQHPIYKNLSRESSFIHYHGKLSPTNLLEEITQYDFGWAGFNGAKNQEHLDTALPNKAIEYVSAGLPVISFGHLSLKRFIEQYGVGIICKEINNLKHLLASEEAKKAKEEVMRRRFDFTLEKNISCLWDFYQSFLRETDPVVTSKKIFQKEELSLITV